MNSDVYFIKSQDGQDDESLCRRLMNLLKEKDLLSFIAPRDMVAVKTHFGEEGTKGYVRPHYFRELSRLIGEKKGLGFLTETSTLYRGKRTNAVEHLMHAYSQGFTPEAAGMPIIMADGLVGDDEIQADIPGKLYKKVGVASLIMKAQALIMVSHFTGHILAGFGATLKNMGMGCASRKGKLIQHSTAKPSVKKKNCTACQECMKWCPADAIAIIDGAARINSAKCIGCGECLAVCRFDAINYNWSETYENLQQKVAEHALAIHESKKGKMLCINFLTRISKDCDCMAHTFQQIIPDIGVLVAFDPVAIDAAAIDLAEQRAGKTLNLIAFDIPCRVQLEHAEALKMGSRKYNLTTV